ncbi:MAG: 1-acyl-sn-glycerol-3-phosphate acyltransferase [Clostridia bacterium]|nr:1-acyl-sn-glycerol-3-phosphate acyltransferase [Clostridia bacterium]
MKIKTKTTSWQHVQNLPKPKKKSLQRPCFLFQALVRLLSIPDLWTTRFTYTKKNMEKAGKGPYLILMNHSSFIDLKIASKLLFPRPYYIISTADGFVAQEWLMRNLGCIPTKKFIADVGLTRDMIHALREKKTSVLLFPEASYSFDGTATPLPRRLGTLLKKLDVPLVYIQTKGAFLRQPLYNNLKLRKVKTSATMQCLLSREEIAQKSVEEIDQILDNAFSFDYFKEQLEDKTVIDTPDRAEGLNRILYKCPSCLAEGKTEGAGTRLTCKNCGKTYEMDVYGQLAATDGKTEFSHIPDWYSWQRSCVKKELENGSYRMDLDVDIAIQRDYKAIYKVGSGKLIHDQNGFALDGCGGELSYRQSPLSSYGLYADYYWYEIGDVICIGDKEYFYYCFPKQKDVVAKARLAAEELYKLRKKQTQTE